MPDFKDTTCPRTGKPCVMGCFNIKPFECCEQEIDRIMEMSKEELWAEHVAYYDGNEKLAQKSIDMMRANVQRQIAQYTRH